jgi:hypothetical protein
MSCPSPPCAHGSALDDGWFQVARLTVAASCMLLLTLAAAAVAHASSPSGPAPATVSAAPCTAATPFTANADLFDTTTAQDPDRTPYDDEDGRETLRIRSPHGALEYALGLRRQSHAGKGSLTSDGLLPHQFVIDSLRRL